MYTTLNSEYTQMVVDMKRTVLLTNSKAKSLQISPQHLDCILDTDCMNVWS